MAKVRRRVGQLDGVSGVDISGIGAMELGEARSFMTSVVDGMRKLGKSREEVLKERAEEEGIGGAGVGDVGGESDDDMVM